MPARQFVRSCARMDEAEHGRQSRPLHAVAVGGSLPARTSLGEAPSRACHEPPPFIEKTQARLNWKRRTKQAALESKGQMGKDVLLL